MSDAALDFPPKPNNYSSEIDGLRAIAVVSVVMFHMALGLPGGYVGVDIFLVISGYLITSHILRDLTAGQFSLTQFWVRRIRRIVPALAVVIAATLIAGTIILLPSDLEELGRTVIAQTLLVANVYFWNGGRQSGGYFGNASEERPLLHTWSLAVEEQFYLFAPLILILLYRFRYFRNPREMSKWMAAAVIGGLGVAMVGMHVSSEFTFYMLPTRVWELLCGSLLASLPAAWVPRSRLLREVLSWTGLVALALPIALYTKTTPFPGRNALPVCLGTALVIWNNSMHRTENTALTQVARLLSLKPLIFIGLISYSFYLWHWPVLVFSLYRSSGQAPGVLARLLMMLVSGVAAWLTWKFVEGPTRRGPSWSPVKAFGLTAALGGLALAAASVAVFTGGVPGRYDPALARVIAGNLEAAHSQDIQTWAQIGVDEAKKGELPVFGADPAKGANTMLLWGDSHSQCAAPAFDAACKEANVTGYLAYHPCTPPVVNAVFMHEDWSLNGETPAFADCVLDFVASHKIRNVVLAANWTRYQDRGQNEEKLRNALSETLQRIKDMGCTVWVLQDVPNMEMNVPLFLARRHDYAMSETSWHCSVVEHAKRNSVLYELSRRDLPAIFVDPAPLFLDEDGKSYRCCNEDGIALYRDRHHLTPSAAVKFLTPLLKERIVSQLSPP